MKAVADQDGRVEINVQSDDGDATASFKVGAIDGVPFEPLHEVEIPDERLDRAIAELLAPFGGTWRRV
jgi:hypothetical protein